MLNMDRALLMHVAGSEGNSGPRENLQRRQLGVRYELTASLRQQALLICDPPVCTSNWNSNTSIRADYGGEPWNRRRDCQLRIQTGLLPTTPSCWHGRKGWQTSVETRAYHASVEFASAVFRASGKDSIASSTSGNWDGIHITVAQHRYGGFLHYYHRFSDCD